jgi:hypothetical protein
VVGTLGYMAPDLELWLYYVLLELLRCACVALTTAGNARA